MQIRLRSRLITLATVAHVMFGATAPAAAQLNPAPGQPALTDVGTYPVPVLGLPPPGPAQGLVFHISWTYDMAAFPDTVFGMQIFQNGLPVSGIVPVEHLPGSLGIPPVASGNRVTQGFNLTFAQLAQLPQGDVRVRVYAYNRFGLSEPSPLSAPLSLPVPPSPGTGPTPPPGTTPPGGLPPPITPDGPPGTPVLARPSVQGNTVSLSWSYTGPAITRFEIIAFVQATGQTLVIPITNPAQRSFTQGGVPSGNFIVRMRAVNATGVGGLSEQFVVPVGVTLGAGDLSVTLTWSSAADIDLHVIEPDNSHVYYANRQGTTARLDRDDTDGLGPENIFVGSNASASGSYRVYIVHYGRSVATTSTIQITINAGTPNERTTVITRSSSTAAPGIAIEVARVNPRNGTITEVAAISAAVQEGDPPDPKGGQQ